eukprot:1945576-Rhodomonas_salina.6
MPCLSAGHGVQHKCLDVVSRTSSSSHQASHTAVSAAYKAQPKIGPQICAQFSIRGAVCCILISQCGQLDREFKSVGDHIVVPTVPELWFLGFDFAPAPAISAMLKKCFSTGFSRSSNLEPSDPEHSRPVLQKAVGPYCVSTVQQVSTLLDQPIASTHSHCPPLFPPHPDLRTRKDMTMHSEFTSQKGMKMETMCDAD